MENPLIPITILTGFLGSGKTTILNRLMKHPESERTAVVINEFGEIGIDHDLLEVDVREDLVLMSSGCLCCTIRGDLSKTLDDLHKRRAKQQIPAFSRVVVETTGLADPFPILHTLMVDRHLVEKYRFDGVVTAVDAANGIGTLNRQEEAVKQAAVADRLLITKSDVASPETLAALQARLQALNPAARRIVVRHGAVAPDDVYGLGLYNAKTKSLDVQRWLQDEAFAPEGSGAQAAHDHAHDDHAHHDHAHEAHHDAHHHHDHHHDINRHDDHIRAFCVTYDQPIAPVAFDAWMEMMLSIRGPDFLRFKGIVNLAGMERPLAIHGVQHIFHPPVPLPRWPSADRRTRLVFITRDIPPAVVQDTLRAFAEASAN